jgi:ribosomal protein L21E
MGAKENSRQIDNIKAEARRQQYRAERNRKMLTVKVNFADGDYIITRINATEQEARDYYEGNIFNIGSVNDNMQRCTNIEILH